MISRVAIHKFEIEMESIKIHDCDENGNERSLAEATLMETFPMRSRITLLVYHRGEICNSLSG